MIEFDYRIEQNYGDKPKPFTPLIPKKLVDLVYIEGLNSKGKSSLLHIIAFGLFGLKNKNISNSLKIKLRDLFTSSLQQVTFSFTITNKQNNIIISSKKPKPDSHEIEVYETIDGKKAILTPESFERKYNLIYDVPENPLGRFIELTRELKDRQVTVGHSIRELSVHLREIIKDVHSSRDPKKLETLKEQLKVDKLQIEQLNDLRGKLESDLTLTKQYYSSRFYLEYKRQNEEALSRLNQLENKKKTLKRKANTISRRKKTLTSEGKRLFEQIEKLISELSYLLKSMKIKTKDDYLSLWKSTDIKNLFLESENHKILFEGINAFKDKIIEYDNSIGSDGRLVEANFLNELIQMLQHYSGVKTTIPGIDKTIPEFILALQSRYRDCEEVKLIHEKYSVMLSMLEDLGNYSAQFIKIYLSELRSISEMENNEDDYQEDSIQEEIDELNVTIGTLTKRQEYFNEEIIRCNATIQNSEALVKKTEEIPQFRYYSTYDEDELESKITDMMKDAALLGERINESQYRKMRAESEINRLEQKKPHKYQNELSKLNSLFSKVQILEQKLLKDFDENLKKLIGSQWDDRDLDERRKKYFDAVWVYLAKKVGNILHGDTEYAITKIDLINRNIQTQSGKTIPHSFFGTGQSQSLYLKGLLQSVDGRKMIALIDEVAMMDKHSLSPIYKIMLEKYKNGSLIVGIVVQKGEKLIVKPIEEMI